MLAGIRHTAVLLLGLVLVAVALSACGDGPSEAEIEATVVARIDEKQAEDAALETKAQAMVEATAQAVPEATPVPPSPTSTPSPTPTQTFTVTLVPPTPTQTPTATSVSPSSTPTLAPNMFIGNSQSFGNSGSVSVSNFDLDDDDAPEQPTSQPSRPIPDKPKHPHLDSRLNKMVRQIGSWSTADVASSAPVSIGDLVGVTVRLSHNSSSTVDFLESVGAIVANIGTDYIEAYTPVTVLVSLSERDGVLRVEAIIPSEPAVTDN